MTKPNDYALIIGVHDYSAADPSGRSDVAGALSDARAWVRQCLAMGFSPDRIHVLTSPKLSPEDFGPVGASLALGEASREGMLAGIRWLLSEIAGEVPAAGLLTFSGHGEASGGHLLLCPSDVTASLDGVIDVAELRQTLGRGKAATNLTALIDGCHGQVGLDRAQSLRGKLRARAEASPVPEGAGVAERVISACRRDQESQSSHFGGERMGAFTWAMTSALGQWRIRRENGVNRSTVSHGELLSRARALLAALSFEQEPVLSGPPGVAALPFLHPGDEVHPGETSEAPDGRRPGRQLDGGQINVGQYLPYQVVCDHGQGQFEVLAQIYVTAASGMGDNPPTIGKVFMQSGMEYWVFPDDVISKLKQSYEGIQYLQIVAGSPTSASIRSSDNASYFTAVEKTQWKGVDGEVAPVDSFVFSGGSGTLGGFALQYEGETPTNVWWVQTGQDNLEPKDMNTMLYATRRTPPSTDFYAASVFERFNPN
ncbi:caspase family protein [Polyangium sp. y55x31]|uniref:caspase family protein n=1 Tax=Polyangium sp. y55x31 TaxID=3042688 RepID=UPI0024827C09|nr:caspase family protein [Polyangium sp. y55x31]MDI1476503.1 caspase family protein [Polyangium sp. y55x31]